MGLEWVEFGGGPGPCEKSRLLKEPNLVFKLIFGMILMARIGPWVKWSDSIVMCFLLSHKRSIS